MKKRVSGLLIALVMVALVVAGCSNNDKKEEKKDRAEADIEWQMISPEDMKKVLETDDSTDYQIIDIQPEADYKKGHLPNSISVPAYPVDTEELEKLVVDNADQFKDGDHPIYVVCPGGGGGAKRTISLLIDEGIDESRLFIVENGAKKWPYKDDNKLWVTD
jgi:rhodanese-related sulfurtransferase